MTFVTTEREGGRGKERGKEGGGGGRGRRKRGGRGRGRGGEASFRRQAMSEPLACSGAKKKLQSAGKRQENSNSRTEVKRYTQYNTNIDTYMYFDSLQGLG